LEIWWSQIEITVDTLAGPVIFDHQISKYNTVISILKQYWT
jgi:hypothetical protein